MVEFVNGSLLSKIKSVKHGFFNRTGGVSDGLYSSLNCGTYSNDDKKNVLKNRNFACSALSSEAKLIEIHQTHSNHVHYYDGSDEIVDADAIVTDQKNIALSVVTADCAPVLFADINAGVIAAAHAGWKGARLGILENTIDAMCSLGAKRARIIAAIGPCIAQNSYEVGQDLYDKIGTDRCFKPSNKAGHYLFDLQGYVYSRLCNYNIESGEITDIDTYDVENNFFSYRRKTHLNEKDYGRQISIILQH